MNQYWLRTDRFDMDRTGFLIHIQSTSDVTESLLQGLMTLGVLGYVTRPDGTGRRWIEVINVAKSDLQRVQMMFGHHLVIPLSPICASQRMKELTA